jgi:2-methylaconitate cis-trans-isomerase PrpF
MGSIPFAVGRSGRSLIAVFQGDDLAAAPDPPMRGRTRSHTKLPATPEATVRDRLLAFRRRGPDWAADLTKAAIITGRIPDGRLAVRFVQVVPGADWADTRGNCGNALVVAAVHAMRQQGAGAPANLPLISANTRQEVTVTALHGWDAETVTVQVRFERPAGSITGRLLPTGAPVDRLFVPEVGIMPVSLIDAGNPYVIVAGERVGLGERSLWQAGESHLHRLELIRQAAAWHLDLPQPSVFPKVAVVTPAPAWEEADVQARMVTVPSWHSAFALTGMVCLGAASQIPGTEVYRMAAQGRPEPGRLVVRHTGGKSAVAVGMAPGAPAIAWAALDQTVTMLGEWEA